MNLDTSPRSMRAGKTATGRALFGLLSAPAPLWYGAPIPPEQRVLITDISKWNGDNNFATMLAAGALATRMRASGGYLNTPYCFTDSKFDANSGQAADLAYPFGVYHFLSNTLSGEAQAEYFLTATIGKRGVLPCVVDVELQFVLASKVRAYVEFCHAELGYYPEIYTSSYFWSKVSGASDKAWLAAHCNLWVAHWGTTMPLLPPDWTDYTCHQFSADGNGRAAEFGSTNGDRDMDLNYCRRSWLEQWVTLPPTLEQRVENLELQVAALSAMAHWHSDEGQRDD